MEQQYPVLIVIIPMFTAMALTLAGWFKPAVCQPLAVAGLLGSFLSAVATLLQIGAGEVISYRLGGWQPPFGIEYRVDSFKCACSRYGFVGGIACCDFRPKAG